MKKTTQKEEEKNKATFTEVPTFLTLKSDSSSYSTSEIDCSTNATKDASIEFYGKAQQDCISISSDSSDSILVEQGNEPTTVTDVVDLVESSDDTDDRVVDQVSSEVEITDAPQSEQPTSDPYSSFIDKIITSQGINSSTSIQQVLNELEVATPPDEQLVDATPHEEPQNEPTIILKSFVSFFICCITLIYFLL